MNELDTARGDTELAARIATYELAFRMQSRAPEAVDLAKETAATTRKLYGLDQKHTAEFGTRCLLARRLVERGVRFVQLYSGGGPVVHAVGRARRPRSATTRRCAAMTDQPVAALLKDLKQRGLLDATLVDLGQRVRPHCRCRRAATAATTTRTASRCGWPAAASRAGRSIGETDEIGLRGVGARYSMRDFHATILHLLGLDQNRLWFLHNGRNEKLTDFGGAVIKEMLA